jgi:hypothetical protein
MTGDDARHFSGSNLSGQVAVVTGGNGGIGLGIAEALARVGADLAIWARDATKNEMAARQLEALGADVLTTSCDVADESDVHLAANAVLERFGRIDICVANAGVGGSGGILDLEIDEWRRVLSVNLDGAFLTIQRSARAMVEQGSGGAIVVVSSTSAMHGAPRFPHYAASKSGVLGLMRSAAVDLARHQIRVNALVPGWTITDMTRHGFESDRFREATMRRIPAQRWATPEEIGRAGVWLADRTHVLHTGQALVVDGGYTIF